MLNSEVPTNLFLLLVTRRALTEMDLMPTLNQDICQGTSKTGSICDVWVPVELQHIYKGSLKGNGSLLNA